VSAFAGSLQQPRSASSRSRPTAESCLSLISRHSIGWRVPRSTQRPLRRARSAQHPPIQVGLAGDGGRMFVDAQRAARETPANTRHPGVGSGGGGSAVPGRRDGVPPGKMRPGAARVDACGGTEVLPEVEQHVHHARPHLSRRRERSRVIPVANDLPLAAEDAVDGERESDREPVHATARTARLVSLDDEVPVVLLDREVDHPEAVDRRPRDGAPECPEHTRRPKGRQAGRCSDRDLHRVAGVNLASGDVRYRRSAPRLPARALASSAPRSGRRERQPHLPRSSRLDCAHVPSSAPAASGCVACRLIRRMCVVGRCSTSNRRAKGEYGRRRRDNGEAQTRSARKCSRRREASG
jgi:hypothetical protein